jgi:tetratricopeptide (TPR) repeat protein
MQGKAIELFESVYAHDKQHPGVLHYLIHGYDDPVHAEAGLAAARAYAKTAAAVPHAYHMPSHIFTRLGYWEEAATTNENAWRISDDDVKAAKEPDTLRDYHSLNYLSYNYLQMGRYRDAKKAVDIFAAQYAAITDRKTAPDSQDLQARHVRGRTIFALPDRILYGYFDTLARFIVESESWDDVPSLPLVAASSEFVVMKLHLEVMAAAHRKDAATAKAKAEEMMTRASATGQHPFVQQVLTIQAREAAAAAAYAAGDTAAAVKEMEAAVALEDAIDSLSQPPYPIIPVHELYGSMLMAMGKPADARRQFEETLKRTPGRPKAIAGIARAAEAMGDAATAKASYTRLIEMWPNADPDRPELQAARRFLQPASATGRSGQ